MAMPPGQTRRGPDEQTLGIEARAPFGRCTSENAFSARWCTEECTDRGPLPLEPVKSQHVYHRTG